MGFIKNLITKIYILKLLKLQLPDKSAKHCLKSMIKESKKDGTYYLPTNLGDIILGLSKSNNKFVNNYVNKIKETLNQKRKEDVRDKDIKWYWNCHELQRRLYTLQDTIIIGQTFIGFLNDKEWKNGKIEDKQHAKEYKKITRKIHPTYYQFLNEICNFYENEDDKPLPIELKDRINSYIMKKVNINPEEYKIDMKMSSSFNALIRKEIKSGDI